MRFVDRTPKRRRNRVIIGYHYLATLPEAVCDASDNEAHDQIEIPSKNLASSVGLEVPTVAFSAKSLTPLVEFEVPTLTFPAIPFGVISPSVDTNGDPVISTEKTPILPTTNGNNLTAI